MTQQDLYLAVHVFRRLSADELVVYRCFKKLPDAGYSVQSADRIRAATLQSDLRQHEIQFLQLFMEDAPDARAGLFSTLEEAIADFERSFEEDA